MYVVVAQRWLKSSYYSGEDTKTGGKGRAEVSQSLFPPLAESLRWNVNLSRKSEAVLSYPEREEGRDGRGRGGRVAESP